MLVLNNDDVKQVLDLKVCVEALETGYRELLTGDAVYTPLSAVYAPCERPDGFYGVGTVGGASRGMDVFALRIKSDIVYWPDGKTEDKYCVRPGTYCGLILVFNTRNGEPVAVLQDGYLQHMRTGGTAALGAKYLARPDAGVVGIVGAGGMARNYLEAFAQVRPLTLVKVFSPVRAESEAYAIEMSQHLGLPVESKDSVEEVVRGSDIVATCTNSTTPIMIEPSWIQRGTHVTNVNPRECEPRLLEGCDLVVRRGRNSSEEQEVETEHSSGYIAYVVGREEKARMPRASRGSRPRYPILLDVLAGKVGRTSSEQVTFFYNCEAHGLGFAQLAGRVWQLARERSLGREIPTEWLLQDIRD